MKSQHQKDLEDLIPPGPYCYVINYTKPESKNAEDGIPVVYCPHSTTKEINQVNVPWCSLLDKGGISNHHTEAEWSRLVEYFGNEDNIFDFLTLDLLWDDCKECGLIDDYQYSKEDAIQWINKIKQQNNVNEDL